MKCIRKGNTNSECSFNLKTTTCHFAYNYNGTKCWHNKDVVCDEGDICFNELPKGYSDSCKSVFILERKNNFYCCHFACNHAALKSKIEKIYKYKDCKFIDITSQNEEKTIKGLLNMRSNHV